MFWRSTTSSALGVCSCNAALSHCWVAHRSLLFVQGSLVKTPSEGAGVGSVCLSVCVSLPHCLCMRDDVPKGTLQQLGSRKNEMLQLFGALNSIAPNLFSLVSGYQGSEAACHQKLDLHTHSYVVEIYDGGKIWRVRNLLSRLLQNSLVQIRITQGNNRSWNC
jgi:hypothetical protein